MILFSKDTVFCKHFHNPLAIKNVFRTATNLMQIILMVQLFHLLLESAQSK